MPLLESYVTWNNKGGVGKTTLTFHMATQYARRRPGVNVLVVDLCPQANVSMALLSSQNHGHGSTHLASLYRQNKTVSFYLQRSLEPGLKVNPKQFVTRVQDYNNQVPANLFLLCGDMYLELVGRHLEHVRSGVVVPRNNPWLNVTSSIRSFIEGLDGKITGVTQDENNWVVFIDTNPAFSVNTEISLAGARKLIVPINADDFSVEAVRAMLDLVYSIHPEDEEEPEDFVAYREYMFSSKATRYGLERPKIHLLVNNRTTTIFTRSATAFSAMGKENLKVLFEAYREHQEECFTPRDGQEIGDIETFKQQYFEDIRDFHTTAILCIHGGCPLGGLSGRVAFNEAGAEVKVDQAKVATYLQYLDRLVEKL